MNQQRLISFKSVLILCLLIPLSSEAGIFSILKGLSKAGKKADVDDAGSLSKLDVDGLAINKLDFDLPDNQQAFVVHATADSNGNWNFKSPDNAIIRQSDAINGFSTAIPQGQKAVLVIDKYRLPNSLNSFDNLPKDIPIYIKDNNILYELTKTDTWRIGKNNISLTVKNLDALKKNLWHLQRPWSSQPVNILSLKTSGSVKTKKLNDTVNSYDVHIDDLERDLQKFRFQTVVIPSNIVGDSISVAGKNSKAVSISNLKTIAEKNDINLVILDAQNQSSIKKMTKHLKEQYANNFMHFNTNDFFQKLLDKKRSVDVEIHPSGQSQTLIEAKFSEPLPEHTVLSDDVSALEVTHTLADLSLRSIQIIRPDQERSKELDRRIFPNIPSDVSLYFIISFISGLICLSFSFEIWNKIWFLKLKGQYSNSFIYYCLWFIHRTLFLFLFLPIAGSFCFLLFCLIGIYKILKAIVLFIYYIIDFIIIRPIKYIFRF